MKIILCDRNRAVVDAWRAISLDAECGSIFDHPADAIVSPANSFGFMDGGIDLAYSEHFGWGVQEEVQSLIQREFDGELLIGQALSVKTGAPDFPTLISAPTMRIAMIIPDPNHIRMATKAAIKEALRIGAKSVAIPGMGAGCGQVRPEWVACMMKAGIEDALLPKPFPQTLNVACAHHWAVKP
ncbi:macro domain-containing protein [Ochrobactrum sp. C6C9]|uniref:macro domain-containing protein n=1 Tax=Ochrobactrum sp. C6C9 TaxID=2736662 RepID=UPI00352FF4C8|nr:macro domain-containing protein [Ochrobactrum sp. C6C9]